jgi:hypothetical protein
MGENISAFNELTGWVFASLYQSHPRGTRLSFSNVPHSIAERISEISGSPRETGKFWNSSIRWLEREGFITFQTQYTNNLDFDGVRLTLSGFQALNAVPESLSTNEPIGEQLIDELKDTGREIRGSAIADLVGQVLGGLLKSTGQST